MKVADCCHLVVVVSIGPEGRGEEKGAGQGQREAAGRTQQAEADREGELIVAHLNNQGCTKDKIQNRM